MGRLRTAVLAVAVLLGPAIAGCGDSESVSQDDLDPVATIRQAATESGRTNFSFTIEGSRAGEQFRGEGQFRAGSPAAMRQSMTSADPTDPSQAGTVEMIIIGSQSWSKFDVGGLEMSPSLPSGKWLTSSLDDEATAGLPEDETLSAESADIRRYLHVLFAAGEVQVLGDEEIEGVRTRHYGGEVTAAGIDAAVGIDKKLRDELAAELRASEGDRARIEAWIDQDLQVRRFVQSGRDSDGEYWFVVTLRDFGKDVEITPPPTDEVVDTSDPKLAKQMQKDYQRRAEKAEKKVRARYGSTAEYERACQKAQKSYLDQSESGEDYSLTAEQEELLTACSAEAGRAPSF